MNKYLIFVIAICSLIAIYQYKEVKRYKEQEQLNKSFIRELEKRNSDNINLINEQNKRAEHAIRVHQKLERDYDKLKASLRDETDGRLDTRVPSSIVGSLQQQRSDINKLSED